jgi:predicted component of type VI protein secretion system
LWGKPVDFDIQIVLETDLDAVGQAQRLEVALYLGFQSWLRRRRRKSGLFLSKTNI